MCFFFSFLPATFWLVLGYFILFSSRKSDGGMRTFGTVLATWVFIIAALIPLTAAWLTLSDLCPLTAWLENMSSSG